MYKQLYLEINLISVFLCVLVYRRMKKNIEMKREMRCFAYTIHALVALLFSDSIWIMVEGTNYPLSYAINCFVDAAFLFLCGGTCYLWWFFAQVMVKPDAKLWTPKTVICSIPLAVLFVMAFASPWTGWMFSVSESCEYQRGAFYFVQLVVSYIYVLAATGHTLFAAFKTKSPYRRADFLTLSSFAIVPSICGVIQAFNYGLPLTWPGMILSLVAIYITLQEHEMTRDSLTGLYNKYSFDRQLNVMLRGERKNELCVIVLELLNSKSINDSFGPLEGNMVLIRISKALKTACEGRRSAFVARYGSNEFAIAFRGRSSSALDDLKASIESEIENVRRVTMGVYGLDIGMGSVSFDECGWVDAQSFISSAESRLAEAYKSTMESSKCLEDLLLEL